MGGQQPPQEDGIAVRPLGAVDNPKLAAAAARILGQAVRVMAQGGARPTAGLLVFSFPDGTTSSLLVAADTAEEAQTVMLPTYNTLRDFFTVPPITAEPEGGGTVVDASDRFGNPDRAVTDPAPPPSAEDTGPMAAAPEAADPLPEGWVRCPSCNYSRPAEQMGDTCGSCGACLPIGV